MERILHFQDAASRLDGIHRHHMILFELDIHLVCYHHTVLYQNWYPHTSPRLLSFQKKFTVSSDSSFEHLINRLKHSWTDSITFFSSHVTTSILTINKTIFAWSQKVIFVFPSCPLCPLWFIRWLWNFIFWSGPKLKQMVLDGSKTWHGRSCIKLNDGNDLTVASFFVL